MRADEFAEFLHRRPFAPFRITLTNGRVLEVHHPEMAILGRSVVAIGLSSATEDEVAYSETVTVSLIHIVLIEALHFSQCSQWRVSVERAGASSEV